MSKVCCQSQSFDVDGTNVKTAGLRGRDDLNIKAVNTRGPAVLARICSVVVRKERGGGGNDLWWGESWEPGVPGFLVPPPRGFGSTA